MTNINILYVFYLGATQVLPEAPSIVTLRPPRVWDTKKLKIRITGTLFNYLWVLKSYPLGVSNS